MLLKEIDSVMKINVIFVVSTTKEANRIAQCLGKYVINAVGKTTLKLCIDPWMRDQNMNQENKGQTGPVRNVYTDATYMK